jgi:hypothetical protein
MFTPEEKKGAIAKRVEASLGSQLEDLIVAVWIVYALTLEKPVSEPHQLAMAVINTFGLHEFGWSTSKQIPGRLALEGEDATLDDRITQYCNVARSHEDEIRPNLVMMLGFVYLVGRDHPNDMMHKWVLGAMARHDIRADAFTDRNPLLVNLVLPDSDQVQ